MSRFVPLSVLLLVSLQLVSFVDFGLGAPAKSTKVACRSVDRLLKQMKKEECDVKAVCEEIFPGDFGGDEDDDDDWDDDSDDTGSSTERPGETTNPADPPTAPGGWSTVAPVHGMRPVGCYHMADDSPPGHSSGFGACFMGPTYARKHCCEGKSNTGFYLGGYWPESPQQTFHNRAKCATKPPPTDKKLPMDKCDQLCPGNPDLRVTFAPTNGYCGGGCRNCRPGSKHLHHCTSDPLVECGHYWSYYEC